ADNPGGYHTSKQVQYADSIHAAGSDLLALITDILDMAKIESGTMSVDVGDLDFPNLRGYVERTFRPVAEQKGLDFAVELADDLPPAVRTDGRRLEQVLRNLLSNAFKFTEHGGVRLRVGVASGGWSPDRATLRHSHRARGPGAVARRTGR